MQGEIQGRTIKRMKNKINKAGNQTKKKRMKMKQDSEKQKNIANFLYKRN